METDPGTVRVTKKVIEILKASGEFASVEPHKVDDDYLYIIDKDGLNFEVYVERF